LSNDHGHNYGSQHRLIGQGNYVASSAESLVDRGLQPVDLVAVRGMGVGGFAALNVTGSQIAGRGLEAITIGSESFMAFSSLMPAASRDTTRVISSTLSDGPRHVCSEGNR
jgi:hypothetical protein